MTGRGLTAPEVDGPRVHVAGVLLGRARLRGTIGEGRVRGARDRGGGQVGDPAESASDAPSLLDEGSSYVLKGEGSSYVMKGGGE